MDGHLKSLSFDVALHPQMLAATKPINTLKELTVVKSSALSYDKFFKPFQHHKKQIRSGDMWMLLENLSH